METFCLELPRCIKRKVILDPIDILFISGDIQYSYLLWTRDHRGGGVSRAVGVGRAVGVITVALVVAGKTGIDGASTELISRGTLVPLVVIYTVFIIQLAESAEQENSQQARNCSMLLI